LRARTRLVWAVILLVAIGLAIAGQRQLSLRKYTLDGVLFLASAVILFLLALTRSRAEEPALWPHNAPAQADNPEASLVPGHMRRLFLVIVLFFSVVAFASLAKNRFTPRGTLCWIGAVLIWLLVTVRVQPFHFTWKFPDLRAWVDILRKDTLTLQVRWVTLLLLCILLVAFFFHVYRIDSLPRDPGSDQAEASLDVWDILNGKYSIYFPRNTGREAMQFYLTAALSHLFGFGYLTLKLTMALVGVLNVIPMYLLGKELLDRRFGLLAAFFMATSYWHVIISRVGFRVVLAPFWTALTLYSFLRALRTSRRNDYLLTGLCLGLGLYGYMAFRVVPLLIIMLCLLKVILERGPGFQLQRFVSNVSQLVITAALVFLPSFRYMYDEPKVFWYRVLTRTTSLETAILRSPSMIFLDNVKKGLLMFNWTTDSCWGQSVMTQPSLDHISGGLLALGAAYLLYLLLARRRPIALYLLLAVFVLLLPSTLALAFPGEVPSNIRGSAVIPVILVMVALPVYVVGKQVVRILRGSKGTILVAVLGGLLLWQVAQLNFRLYFVDYNRSYHRANWNASDMARVIRGFGNSMGSIYDAYIIGTAYWVDHRTVSVVLGDMKWNNLLGQVNAAEAHLAEPRTRLYIFNPANSEAERWLLEHYPSGQLMRFQAYTPDKDFMIFLAPAQR